MEHEMIDCIDAGSEFCPCHLAESGDCILCSQLSGKKFCDCVKWKGVCIYQEYIWNGNKSKEGRKTYKGIILEKEKISKDTFIFTIGVTHKLAEDLNRPGSFVFLRGNNDSEFYNSPISVMESNEENNSIKLVVQEHGIKTKAICDLNINEYILVKGPFWNGVLGLDRIKNAKDKTSLILARGIGQAPSVQVIKKLHDNGNKIIMIVDRVTMDNLFIRKYLDKYNVEIIESSIFYDMDITKELEINIEKIIKEKDINIIHCSANDIVILKLIKLFNEKVNITCCNNEKMCCGEGLCGACTCFKNDKVRRMCKVQTNPEHVFMEKKLI